VSIGIFCRSEIGPEERLMSCSARALYLTFVPFLQFALLMILRILCNSPLYRSATHNMHTTQRADGH
jgi:hypothetical protein